MNSLGPSIVIVLVSKYMSILFPEISETTKSRIVGEISAGFLRLLYFIRKIGVLSKEVFLLFVVYPITLSV